MVDTFADRLYSAAAFVAKNNWEKSFGIVSTKSVSVSVAHAGEIDFHSHLACSWWINGDSLDFQLLFWAPCNGGFARDHLTDSAHS
jgi:hypothetical protein